MAKKTDSARDQAPGDLTGRQGQVLQAIENFISKFGYPPSIRELAEKLSIASPRGVQRHLEVLAKKGFIKRTSLARGIQLVKDFIEEKIPARVLPLLGRVAAGTPILAEENVEEMIAVPAALASSSGDQFLLRVKGDSMIDDHIQEGDLVIVRQQPTAEPGQIVVAMIEGEATVKRFYKEKDRIRLQPANKNYQPICAEGAQVTIIGRVMGLLRSLK